MIYTMLVVLVMILSAVAIAKKSAEIKPILASLDIGEHGMESYAGFQIFTTE